MISVQDSQQVAAQKITDAHMSDEALADLTFSLSQLVSIWTITKPVLPDYILLSGTSAY